MNWQNNCGQVVDGGFGVFELWMQLFMKYTVCSPRLFIFLCGHTGETILLSCLIRTMKTLPSSFKQ